LATLDGIFFNSGTSSLLLNGVPGKTFHCKREVRQGDPLSPLPFVLVADFLQELLNKAKEMNLSNLPIPFSYTSDFPIIQYDDDSEHLLYYLMVFRERLSTARGK
jgi:hypothetical protein